MLVLSRFRLRLDGGDISLIESSFTTGRGGGERGLVGERGKGDMALGEERVRRAGDRGRGDNRGLTIEVIGRFGEALNAALVLKAGDKTRGD